MLLKIKGLKTYFFTDYGTVKAVDDIDLCVDEGESLGLVGESGCGKSVTALSILRLIPFPPGKIVQGEILFKGRDLLKLNDEEMRKVRGKDISMIFQEPMTSLNPVFTIGDQIAEAIKLHQKVSGYQAWAKAIEMLRVVAMPDPEKRVYEYPHQLSGGMRQRAMIAMALSCTPALLIADEPTTALDVTIQAQILELLANLKERYKLALLLITHDLGIVAEIADRVAVMYAGKIVEEAESIELYQNPLHPYTQGLLKSVPRLDKSKDKSQKLDAIEGVVPDPYNMPKGCYFQPRCKFHLEKCIDMMPEFYSVNDGHKVRCFLFEK